MSTTVDERVVEMKLNNSQFLTGVKTTLDAFNALKKGMNMEGAAKGLSDVDAATKRLSFESLAAGVDGIKSKFSAMSIVAITALTNIANKAINAGTQLVRSLTLQPIKAGFDEYELKMGSIQTILSNTARYGTKLPEVTKNLDELNTYADKTIYSFGDMTKNIGLFTNAGIKVGDATQMIKGFSNEAAASGTSAQGAASAAYQLSQALSAGKVTLMDWRSLQNVGMGNKNMQRGIIDIADAMGTMKAKGTDASKVQKDFNGSLEKGWLTADVMSSYLRIMAGDMSEAEMKTMGLTKTQISSFKLQQKNAEEAATKVRTFTQLLGTMRESVGSGWSETFDTLIGDFNQATKLWTGVNNTLGGLIGAQADARNKLLKSWAKMGGRDVLIKGLGNAFSALMGVIKPVQQAFRDIFPPMTAKRLYELTVIFKDFTEKLKMGEQTAFKVRRIFQGVFAALDIGRMIVVGVVKTIAKLLGVATEGSGGFLDFAAKIADWVTGLRHAIKYGDGLTKFFSGLQRVLSAPIILLRGFVQLIAGLFTGKLNTGIMTSAFDRVAQRLQPLKKLGDTVVNVWKAMMAKLQGVVDFMGPFATQVADAFRGIGDAIANSLKTGDFSGVLDTINTGLFGGLLVLIRKFLKNGFDFNVDVGGGMFQSITKAFGGVTDTLTAMQQQLKANVLLKIAAAIGILTISVVALSLIDSAALTKALTAITIMFGQLAAAMAIFTKVAAGGGMAKLALMGVALILFATAIDILAIAVKKLSDMNWGELIKGLTAVLVLLAGLAGASQLLSKNSTGMISMGIGLIAVAVAIKILASAVKDFAEMDWATMLKGLAGVGIALAALAIFTRLAALDKAGVSSGAGLLLLAVSLKVIASAINDFGSMDWQTLGKGFAAMAVSLGLIAAAIALLPKTMLLQAAGLVVVATSLVILAGALKLMGGMSWEEIAKGLVTLAGSLLIIAGAMYLMSGALPGAAALLVVAASLAVLAPVLVVFGNMAWDEILRGLTMLAGVFVVIGAAGLLLAPVVPVLIGLGIAITLLGVGTLAAGLGLLAFSAGLTALSIAGAAGAAALTAIAAAIIGLIPMALKAVGEGLVLLAGVIAKAGPQFTAAMTTLMLALIKAINNVVPKIVTTILNLLFTLVNSIANAVPKFVDAGYRIIIGLLNGIANNLPKVIAAAVNVVTKFLRAIGDNLPKVIQAGVDLILKFIRGITNAINQNSAAVGKAGGDLAVAIVKGMVNGIANGIGSVVQAAKNLASSALQAAKNFLGIASPSKEFTQIGRWSSEGFAVGIDKYAGKVITASEGVGAAAIDSMRKSISGLSELVNRDLDANPTITPVLDLSQFKKAAAGIDSKLPTPTLGVRAAWADAKAVSANYNTNQAARSENETAIAAASQQLTFNQYNNSPRALSEAEIYRQTKNQISVAKEALATNAKQS